MKHNIHHRIVCAVCALALLVTGLSPVAAFAQEDEAAAPQTLTAAQVREMQQADDAVTALTDSTAYADMTADEREAAALQQLDALVEQGLVAKGSIYVDEENDMVSFAYSCGALGGILLADPDESEAGSAAAALQDEMAQALAAAQTEEENSADAEDENRAIGKAIIYYAFDNGQNSSRYPYYPYMRDYWGTAGLATKLERMVTVSSLRKMGEYDLAVISAHGAYYTYQYGWLWKRQATQPLILLLEKSDFWNDLRYGMDLLSHRVIKINGAYAVTGDFFRAAYRGGQLHDTIVISETCEFYGRSGHLDTSIVDALLDSGAKAVVGFINNVYSVYSRSMLWAMVNRMLEGQTVQQAMEYGMQVYGEDDVIWYRNQNTMRPAHAVASYAIISGDAEARLTQPTASAAMHNVQDAA